MNDERRYKLLTVNYNRYDDDSCIFKKGEIQNNRPNDGWLVGWMFESGPK